MRILHTADWHIGKRLYQHHRTEEHQQFLDWLLNTIIDQHIDVLLISGDVFDTALPSSESMQLYYYFLHRLYTQTDTTAVITAGNHDAAVRLEADRDFLKMGRIHVFGTLRSDLSQQIVYLPKDHPKIAIVALPYLSENEILSHQSLESTSNRHDRYRSAIRQIYRECVNLIPTDLGKILMGHLTVQGASNTGSERNILIGGLNSVRVDDFPSTVDYVALGHLHQSQSLSGQNYPIRYSGTPIPMTFREAKMDKKISLIEFNQNKKMPGENWKEITIPTFRRLVTLEGEINQILSLAASIDQDWKDVYIEVKLLSSQPTVGMADQIRQAFADRGGYVLTVEIITENHKHHNFSASDIVTQSPQDVFDQFYREKHSVQGTDLFNEVDDFKRMLSQLLEQIENDKTGLD